MWGKRTEIKRFLSSAAKWKKFGGQKDLRGGETETETETERRALEEWLSELVGGADVAERLRVSYKEGGLNGVLVLWVVGIYEWYSCYNWCLQCKCLLTLESEWQEKWQQYTRQEDSTESK